MENKKSVLEVSNLKVCFADKEIISHFSLKIAEGERVSICGESGSGKSTLLKCILGFIQPSSGTIFISGEQLTAKNVWHLRGEVGFVPQETDLGRGIVMDIIHRPFRFKSNRYLEARRERISELFQVFSLEENLLNEDIALVSGGEKQRIALIAALLLERRIYLLDEVTSALDERVKKKVVGYLTGRKDLSLLVVTHDKHFLSSNNRVYHL